MPAALVVDPTSTAASNGNGVFEPGETVAVQPAWQNVDDSGHALTGAASGFTGPAGATYTLLDDSADYGTIAPAETRSCDATPELLFDVRLVARDAAPAPLGRDLRRDAEHDRSSQDLEAACRATASPTCRARTCSTRRSRRSCTTGSRWGATETSTARVTRFRRSQMAIFIATRHREGAPLPASGRSDGSAGPTTVRRAGLGLHRRLTRGHLLQGGPLHRRPKRGRGATLAHFCTGSVTRARWRSSWRAAIVAPGGGAAGSSDLRARPGDRHSPTPAIRPVPILHFTDVHRDHLFCKHITSSGRRESSTGCSSA